MTITYPMAVITAPGTIEFQQKMLIPLGDHDVLVKIMAAAICGSDLHLYKGLHPSVMLPSAVGHEASGEIIEIGRLVTKHKVGDRVTIEPVIACGKCEYCVRGDYHLCASISFQYRKGQGAFSPWFIVHENRAFRLPDNISYEEGSLLEPLSVALHAVKRSGISLGHTSAIFGAGAIGILVSMLSRQASGIGSFICDIHPYRLQKALDLGARQAINSCEQDPVEAILEATDGLGVDKSFEAVGLESTLSQALHALKHGANATLLGIFEQLENKIPIHLFVQREISLFGSQGYSWDFQDALNMLAMGTISVKPLITHTLPFQELKQGFDILLNPKNESIKVIIKLSDQ
ncbi:MAG: alcohol dehydrogenase catalytic domain-containing protein [Anaerolineaceae bacterium]|nr:alcohol dehydrogenase catalytic domain-containing protein [Anaerolineaceae bacterium]